MRVSTTSVPLGTTSSSHLISLLFLTSNLFSSITTALPLSEPTNLDTKPLKIRIPTENPKSNLIPRGFHINITHSSDHTHEQTHDPSHDHSPPREPDFSPSSPITPRGFHIHITHTPSDHTLSHDQNHPEQTHKRNASPLQARGGIITAIKSASKKVVEKLKPNRQQAPATNPPSPPPAPPNTPTPHTLHSNTQVPPASTPPNQSPRLSQESVSSTHSSLNPKQDLGLTARPAGSGASRFRVAGHVAGVVASGSGQAGGARPATPDEAVRRPFRDTFGGGH